jgi:aryl-alcohol dehydrogenase-like predicted oxidoreductase
LSPEQVLDRGGVADTFDRLKEQGLIQACGMTAAGETQACLEVISSGRFDTAQVYYNAINPSAAWRRVPPGWKGGQDLCGIISACFHQHMGVLNIRVWAGGSREPERPDRLFVMQPRARLATGALRRGRAHGAGRQLRHLAQQAALRFVLGTATWRRG